MPALPRCTNFHVYHLHDQNVGRGRGGGVGDARTHIIIELLLEIDFSRSWCHEGGG